MRVLALEPYYGGSHRAFLDGWTTRSRHQWTVLGLPAYKWKWRMRHAAVTFAEEVTQRARDGQAWDVLWCSDMLNLAEFLGLAPAAVHGLPSVVYFHENQITYPVQFENERDHHFGFTNLTTALAADEAWFNSAYHRDSLLQGAEKFLRRKPDFRPSAVIGAIRHKAVVQWPGVDPIRPKVERPPGPLRILWAARWEHDKAPELFFEALEKLMQRGVEFRVSVLGQSFRESPEIFASARQRLAEHIDCWGFQPTRSDYEAALAASDVFVSTARHEFFGLSAVEAMTAGAYPLLPRRLAYPELLAHVPDCDEFFYDGTVGELAQRLEQLAGRVNERDGWKKSLDRIRPAMQQFHWEARVKQLDEALESGN